MKLSNAIKKLEKLGATIHNNGRLYQAHLPNGKVSFVDDQGRVTAIETGGVWCDNLTQALVLL